MPELIQPASSILIMAIMLLAAVALFDGIVR